MIQAATSSRFPYLQMYVQLGSLNAPSFAFDTESLVDTGFDGGLAVGTNVIPHSISPDGRSTWHLADGTPITAHMYVCYVTIGHLQPVPTILITLDGDALLGRDVTDQFRVTFDHGRQIIVEA